jgi:hypothetical protein
MLVSLGGQCLITFIVMSPGNPYSTVAWRGCKADILPRVGRRHEFLERAQGIMLEEDRCRERGEMGCQPGMPRDW